MGGLFGSSKQTSTSRVELPEWANRGLSQTADRALGLMERPYQGYTGDRTAGLSGWTSQGAQTIGDASRYQPGTVTSTNVAAERVTPGSLAGRDLSAYYDPYEQQVIDASLADIDRSTRVAQAGRAAGGVGAAGFGGFGDRAAVAGAEIERAGIDAKARTAAGLRSAGFQRAQDLATTDINREFQGQSTNAQLGLQAGLANQTAGQRAQEFNVQSGLAGAQQRAQSAAALAGLGEIDRGVRQAGLDVGYQDFREQRDDPFLKTQWAAGVIGGNSAPYAGNTTQTTPGQSTLGQLAGLGTSAAAIYSLLSDPDDKTDRRRLGTDPATGLGIWAFRYKGDGKGSPKVVGPMADEVAEKFPHLVRSINGHRVIDMAGLAELAGGHGEGRGFADGGLAEGWDETSPFRSVRRGTLGSRQRRWLRDRWAEEDLPYPQTIEGVAEPVPMTDAWTGTPAIPGMGAGGPSFRGEADEAAMGWGTGVPGGEGLEQFAPGSVPPDFGGEGVAGGETLPVPPAVRAALARLRPRPRQGAAGPVFPGEQPVAPPIGRGAGPGAAAGGARAQDAVAAEAQPTAALVPAGGAASGAPGGAAPDGRGWVERFGDRLVDPDYAGTVALLQAGLGMMASRNPNWAGAIGEGALLGLQSAERARPLVRQRRDQQQLQELIRGTDVSPAIRPRRAAPSGGAPAAGQTRMTSVPVPAEGGGVAIPEALRPAFEAASRETGIPVPVLAAVARQESNFDPAARGAAGEIGLMQVMPSTASRPGFGLDGVDPASLDDPAANILFGARYLRARAGADADLSNPQALQRALLAYNGGGDPNYVQNVRRWMPGAAEGQAARGGGEVAPGAAPEVPDVEEAEPAVQIGGRAFTRSQLLGMAAAAPGNEAVQRFVGMALPVVQAEVARREASADRRLARQESADLRRELAGRSREPMPTELNRLITERDALPAGDPRRASYDAAIRRASGEAAAERFTPAQLVQLRRDAFNSARQEAAGLDFETEAERTGWITQRGRELLGEWGAAEAMPGAGGGGVTAPLSGEGARGSGVPDEADATADNGARIRPRGRARSLSDRARTDLGAAGEALASFNVLTSTFDPEFGGFGFAALGDAANLIARNTPGESPRADWWSRYQERKNLIRNQLFGSALTATEKAEFDKASINPGMSAEAIRTNLARQQRAAQRAARRLATALRAAGYPEAEVVAALGMPIPDDAPEPVDPPRRGAGGSGQRGAPPPAASAPAAPPARPPLESFMR